MKAMFMDVSLRKQVEAEVLDAVQYKNGACAFKAKTTDGRSLTRFISKDEYAKFMECKGGKGGKACKAKK